MAGRVEAEAYKNNIRLYHTYQEGGSCGESAYNKKDLIRSFSIEEFESVLKKFYNGALQEAKLNNVLIEEELEKELVEKLVRLQKEVHTTETEIQRIKDKRLEVTTTVEG